MISSITLSYLPFYFSWWWQNRTHLPPSGGAYEIALERFLEGQIIIVANRTSQKGSCHS